MKKKNFIEQNNIQQHKNAREKSSLHITDYYNIDIS